MKALLPVMLVIFLCAVVSSVEPSADSPKGVTVSPLVVQLDEMKAELATVKAENSELKATVSKLIAERQIIIDASAQVAAKRDADSQARELQLTVQNGLLSKELEAARKGK